MAKTNYQRYQNPAAAGLLRALADSEPGSPAEAAALRPLEKLMVDEAPIIPLFQVDAAGMWRTDRFSGWPSEKDPYAVPIGNHVNAEVLVTSLSPVGK
jgi:peptide/nickel transport system substrate-binding protein